MNLKELLSDIIQPVCAIVMDENTNRVDAVKAIENAWQNKLKDVETIVEAIVADNTNKQLSEAKKEFEADMKNDFDDLTKTLTDRLTSFLEEAREFDRKENQNQIIAEAKVEVMSEAMSSIIEALSKSSIIVDTDSKAQLEIFENKAKDLENKLNGVINENIELKKSLSSQKFNTIFDSIRSELKLSDVQANRLKSLTESFANQDNVGEKIRLLATTIVNAKSEGDENNTAASIEGAEIIVEDENASPQAPEITTEDPLWLSFNNTVVD